MEPGETTRYLELSEKVNDLTEQIGEARRAGELCLYAALRLERASFELELRDLFGWRTRLGERWDFWMRDDLAQANQVADQLARRVGDSQLPGRLLIPFPTLQGLAS